MRKIERQATVVHSAKQMYALVDDVEKYPEFLPWCPRTVIHERDDDAVKASIYIAAMGFEKSFTTHNRCQKDKMIEIRLVDGPFSHLEGFWLFEDKGVGSSVLLNLEFEIAGGMMNFALDPIFHQVASTFVDAFVTRADAIYQVA